MLLKLSKEIHEDAKQYGNYSIFKTYISNDGFKVTFYYRIVKYLYKYKNIKILYNIFRIKYRRKCVKYGCDIPSSVNIGCGFKIDHPFGIVINSKCKIGNYVTIKCGTIVGKNDNGVPIIGNNVIIGANATIIGNIKIEDNAKIGAGAIVVHDVIEGTTVINQCAREVVYK